MSFVEFNKLLNQIKGENVLVVGAGVTGRPAAKLFREAKFNVFVLDEKSLSPEIKSELNGATILENFKVSKENIKKLNDLNFSFALISPGINPRSDLGGILSSLKIPIFSELDVAFPYLGMPAVAVTGTNGKTTVVHLIEQMLKEDFNDVELVGNVGYSFLSKMRGKDFEVKELQIKEKSKVWVAELSSYQLEGVHQIKPKVSVLLNIDDDHLERHGSLAAYVAAKSRIFLWQDKDCWSIINCDEFWTKEVEITAKGKIFYFGKLNKLEEVGCKNGCFYLTDSNELVFALNGKLEKYSLKKTKLLGIHNKLNLTAATAAARLSACSTKSVQKVIDDFLPLAHRVELVREVGGVSFINDSKGTNVSAVIVALDMVESEFPNGNVILLVGGKIKEGSWQGIRTKINQRVKAVISFGGDRDLVLERLGLKQSTAEDSLIVKCIEKMQDAVLEAKKLAAPGDVVLLSPGCASFDAFKDYVDRGEQFKKCVNSL